MLTRDAPLRIPGPTFDTEYIQSPLTGEWLLVPKVPTYEEMRAHLISWENLSPETVAKIDRANFETMLLGYPSRRSH